MKNSNKQEQNQRPIIDDLISLSEAAKISGLSPNHLRLLVGKKIIWGKKLGRNWFTTALVVEDYLKLDRKPGPRSQINR